MGILPCAQGLKPFCGSGRPRILAVCDVDGVAEEAHLVAGGHKSTYVRNARSIYLTLMVVPKIE